MHDLPMLTALPEIRKKVPADLFVLSEVISHFFWGGVIRTATSQGACLELSDVW